MDALSRADDLGRTCTAPRREERDSEGGPLKVDVEVMRGYCRI